MIPVRVLQRCQSLAFLLPFAGLLAANPAAAGVGTDEPRSGTGPADSGVPSSGPVATPASDSVTEIPASAFGFSPMAPESPAFGPDLLAIGPEGAVALWDPVRFAVFGVVGPDVFALPLDHADSLAWTTAGDLLVLDESSRTLTRWGLTPFGAAPGGPGRASASQVAAIAMDRLCPVGVRLAISGDLAFGIDAFGNAHPLADLVAGLAPPSGPRLWPPSHVVRLHGGELSVDGVRVNAPIDALGGRLLGDWVLVEAGQRGAVRQRLAISLITGRQVELPLGGRYRPAKGVNVGLDGALGYLDTAGASLVVVQVAP